MLTVHVLHTTWFYYPEQVEGDLKRTRSEEENELNENKVQFARIRDKNPMSEYFKFLFEIYIE